MWRYVFLLEQQTAQPGTGVTQGANLKNFIEMPTQHI